MDRYNQDSKSNTSFERVASSQSIESVAELAQEIWDEHYTPIIGKGQVNYMLENLHSTEKLTQEINIENHEYFLIKSDNKIIGYLGYQIKKDGIFLNRLYLHQTKRGLGIGRKAIELIQRVAIAHKLNRISLRVNKNNLGSIVAYYRLGFKKADEVCTKIGGTYVMDDLIMQLTFSE